MRYTYIIFSLVLLSLSALNGKAQQFLTGKIYEKGSRDSLISVSIHNITIQRYDLSEENGSYKIQCSPGRSYRLFFRWLQDGHDHGHSIAFNSHLSHLPGYPAGHPASGQGRGTE